MSDNSRTRKDSSEEDLENPENVPFTDNVQAYLDNQNNVEEEDGDEHSENTRLIPGNEDRNQTNDTRKICWVFAILSTSIILLARMFLPLSMKNPRKPPIKTQRTRIPKVLLSAKIRTARRIMEVDKM